jgi:hypothetical protein
MVRRSRRGVVLIVVLGVLVLLSLLAASFATLASVERAVARSPVPFFRPGGLYRAGHQRDARGDLLRGGTDRSLAALEAAAEGDESLLAFLREAGRDGFGSTAAEIESRFREGLGWDSTRSHQEVYKK